MRVLMCPADRAPYICHLSGTLQSMQNAVGGHIEVIRTMDDAALIVCEEGRLRCMPENRSVPWTGIVGDAFFCGVDGEEFCDIGRDALRFLMWQAKARWADAQNGPA